MDLPSYKSEKDVEANLIRPLFHDVLGYPAAELEWGKPVRFQMGREVKTKQADLVVHRDRRPVIMVEAKRPTEPVLAALGQTDSYAFALRTPFSLVTNGRHLLLRGYYAGNRRINILDESVDKLVGAGWDELVSLISFANIESSLSDKPNQIAEPSAEKIRDYRRFFRRIHNAIRDRDRLDPGAAFDELSKLLFLKAAEDEARSRVPSRPILTPATIADFELIGKGPELVNQWFDAVTREVFPGVFDNSRIQLSTETLREVLGMLEPFHVKNGDVDVKGRAFEEFLPSQLRGEGLGQYFTPRPIVNFMVDLAEVSIQDIVVDFACGSGGFLIKAFEHMQDRVAQMPDGTLRRLAITRDQLLEDIKSSQIFGVDAEPRAARTAKMNMLMWGDGKRVVRGNALAPVDMNGDPYTPPDFDPDFPDSGATLILANPPFGSSEKDQRVLRRYELGSKYQERKSEKTEILFIEKGLNLLRPEGRMLIVLPQGILSGRMYKRVRDYIHAHAEIRAIVSLPTHAFVQSGVPTVNTCVLYLQKFTAAKREIYQDRVRRLGPEQARESLRKDSAFDYPIFMATAEYVGYEPSGRSILVNGEPTDLDLILRDFRDQATALPTEPGDPFEFAAIHYGDKTTLRREQTIRGTQKGLKTSFQVPFRDIEDRLDPPFHFFRLTADDLVAPLDPLGGNIDVTTRRFRPATDDELDAEYPILTVSSDGKLTVGRHLRGEDFTQGYKLVREGDIVYNPSRVNIGSIGVVTAELDKSFVSPEYVVFHPRAWDSEFLVDLLRSPFYRMYIDIVTTGSIRDRLLRAELETIRVPSVDDRIQMALAGEGRKVEKEAEAAVEGIGVDKARLAKMLHVLVASNAESEVRDVTIARTRLAELGSNSELLISGDDLVKRLDSLTNS